MRAWVLLLLVGYALCITVPSECTNAVASVVSPASGDSIALAVTADVPVLCLSVLSSTSSSDQSYIKYTYQVADEEYLSDNDLDVLVSMNFNCDDQAGSCASTLSAVDMEQCSDGASLQALDRFPVAVNLVLDSSKTVVFSPEQSVTVMISFEWVDGSCGEGQYSWIAWLLVGLFGAIGIPLVLLLVMLFYIKRKNDKKANAIVYADSSENGSYNTLE